MASRLGLTAMAVAGILGGCSSSSYLKRDEQLAKERLESYFVNRKCVSVIYDNYSRTSEKNSSGEELRELPSFVESMNFDRATNHLDKMKTVEKMSLDDIYDLATGEIIVKQPNIGEFVYWSMDKSITSLDNKNPIHRTWVKGKETLEHIQEKLRFRFFNGWEFRTGVYDGGLGMEFRRDN